MKKLTRLAAGLSFGAALALVTVVISPGTASAYTYQCDETENYVCCCNMVGDLVYGCDCRVKPRPIIT